MITKGSACFFVSLAGMQASIKSSRPDSDLLTPTSLSFYRFLPPRPILIRSRQNNLLPCQFSLGKMPSDEEKRQTPQEPPNGGARAWGVALGAFAAQMYVWAPPKLYFRVSSI